MGWWLVACQPTSPYLDTEYPGLTPQPYAEGIVNVPGRFQQNITLSPDGREHYLTQTDAELWRYERILRISQSTDGEWTLDTPQFVKDFTYTNVWFIGEPMLTPDGQQLHFVADYPPDLYRVQRTEEGLWGPPSQLAASTDTADWYPTFTDDQNLYFTYGTMRHAAQEGGDWVRQGSLAIPIPGGDVRDPVMSPDG
ncbi:MAG TPA: hypothetical protein DCR93_21885, partial [Cytophagales bacterium]|nr:hypothetical protein [Cytophagales bacterium]